MRHVGSLIAGMLIAPLAWLLIAIGQQKSSVTVASWVGRGAFDSADLLQPAAYLLGAGLLLGLIATLRISPVGPIVAGLALLGTYVSLFVDPLSVMNSLKPIEMGSLTADLRIPVVNGTTAVLGLALLVAAASVKRWRPWPTSVPVPAGGADPLDIHEYPLGQGPTAPPPVAARPPYGATQAFPAAATSVLPGSDETQPVRSPGGYPGYAPPAPGGAAFPVSTPPAAYPVSTPPVVSAPPVVSGPPVVSAPPVASGAPFAVPAVVSGPPGPFPPAPPGGGGPAWLTPESAAPSDLPMRPPTGPVSSPPPYGGGQPAALSMNAPASAPPMSPPVPPVQSAPPAQSTPIVPSTPPVPSAPPFSSPAPLAPGAPAASVVDDVPAAGAIAYSRGATSPAPAAGEGATQVIGGARPVSTPPVSPPPSGDLGPSGSWPVIPAPGGSAGADDVDATRPLQAAAGSGATGSPAEMPSGLPSRAARGEVPSEQSILGGPSFDGFAVPARGGHEDIRPGQDEETEAFHPGRQAPVPTRPRHAAAGETGQPPAATAGSAGDDVPRSRFQPMAPQPPAEATTVLSAQPAPGGADAFKPAPGVTAAGGDSESEATTRFQAPDPEATANFGFGPSATGPGAAPAEAAADEPEADVDPDATRALGTDIRSNSPWAHPPRDRG